MADATTRRIALYSVLLGGYEHVNEQPVVADRCEDDVARILLTDDASIESDFWEVVVVEPALPGDPVRSQRLLKILGHPVLDEFDATLYVDNALTLRTPPGALLETLLGDHDAALPLHSYRETVLDEFDEVLRLQYDEPARVHEQLVTYADHHAEMLEAVPYWTAMIARRRTAKVAAAMRVWADHVLRHSRRDQLSARIAFDRLDVRPVELENMASEHHEWPTDLGRRTSQGKALEPSAGPFVAELRRRDRAAAIARANEAEARSAERTAVAARDALAAELAEVRDVVSLLESRLERERATRASATDEALAARVALRSVRSEFERSTSWRVTSPLRGLDRIVRGRR